MASRVGNKVSTPVQSVSGSEGVMSIVVFGQNKINYQCYGAGSIHALCRKSLTFNSSTERLGQ